MNKKRVKSAKKGIDTIGRSARQLEKAASSLIGAAGKIVSAPVSVGTSRVASAPKGGNTRIQHSEFVMDVVSSGSGFDVTSIRLNAANKKAFRWMGAIARAYDQYKFVNVRLVYQPRCATSLPGSLLVAFDPNAGDDSPKSKQDMLAMRHNMSTNVWSPVEYTVPGKVLSDRGLLFTSGRQEDNHLNYDLGQLLVATDGVGTISTVGEIHLRYTVELKNPQAVNSAEYGHYRCYVDADAINNVDVEQHLTGVSVASVEKGTLFPLEMKMEPSAQYLMLTFFNASVNPIWDGTTTPTVVFKDQDDNVLSAIDKESFSSNGTAIGSKYAFIYLTYIEKSVLDAVGGKIYAYFDNFANTEVSLQLKWTDRIYHH